MKLAKSKFIVSAAVLGAGLAAGGTVTSTAQAKELKLAHFMPPVHHLHKQMFAPMAKELAAATNGKLTMKIFSSGALGKGPVQQYKRVVQGVADIAFGVLVYTPKLFPKTMIASNPGIGTTSQEVTKKIWNVYEEHFADEYKKTKLLALFANWPSVLISRKTPIKTLADMKGLKTRVSSPADVPLVNAWGAVAIHMSVTKTYTAMQNGVIDAIQIAPSALQRPWKLAEPGDFVSTGVKGTSSIFFVMMNNKSWNGLSGSEKKAIENLTGKEASIKISTTWGGADKKALAAAKAGKQIQLVTIDPAEAAKFDAISETAIRANLAKLDKTGMKATTIYNALTQ
jgi:TRAP-type C4-dicarboxylate transport system substrate-binding protein